LTSKTSLYTVVMSLPACSHRFGNALVSSDDREKRADKGVFGGHGACPQWRNGHK